ncbi:MAG: substrate-binding domain-containing protein [Lachnospiraceae bacterium]|nr:substrate-binding domain-containing protein [Lachnospiraceae bacterium]
MRNQVGPSGQNTSGEEIKEKPGQQGGTEPKAAKKKYSSRKQGERRMKALLLSALIIGAVTLIILVVSIYLYAGMIKERDSLLSSEGQTPYDGYYVLVTEDGDSDFWENVLAGAREKAEAENIYVQQQTQAIDADLTKSQQLELAIHSGVDGIILDGGQESQTESLINQAAAAGIPVVTVYRDSPSSERISYIGISNANLGRDYGQEICDLTQKKIENEEQDSMKVLVLLDAEDPGNSQTILLTAIRDYIHSQGMSGKVQIETRQIRNSSFFSAEEEIRELFAEGGIPADIIVALSEHNTECVAQTVVDYNRVGSVEILGFYESEPIRNALEKNIIHATVTADTLQMGRDSVEALSEFRESGYVSDYYATEISLLHGSQAGESVEENTEGANAEDTGVEADQGDRTEADVLSGQEEEQR